MAKTIQMRNVPGPLYTELKARAAQEGVSLSEFLNRELVWIAERHDLLERLEPGRKLKSLLSDASGEDGIRHFRGEC